MLTQERQGLIEEFVNQHQVCHVSDLCELTNTSESTIRRDLIQMEKLGLLKRVHGGAQSVKNFSQDIAQTVRFNLNHDQKQLVARYAAQNFVKPGDNIFIDAGTTTYEMVAFLSNIPNLHVVTNGVETALSCLNHGISTILIGGKVKADTHAVVGSTAISQIKGMHFSASFIGANGISSDGSITTPDSEEAAVKMAEITQSQHAFVVTDSSKIGVSNFAVFAKVQDVTLITDEINESKKKLLNKEVKLEEVK